MPSQPHRRCVLGNFTPCPMRCGILLCAVEYLLVLMWALGGEANFLDAHHEYQTDNGGAFSLDKREAEGNDDHQRRHPVAVHSCIHDHILERRHQYTVSPQMYDSDRVQEVDGHVSENSHDAHVPRAAGDRRVLSMANGIKTFVHREDLDRGQPIRIFLNYDAVGSSRDRDCRNIGDVVKLGDPNSVMGFPTCNHKVAVIGDCWYNCTAEDVADAEKQERLHAALTETAEWFKNALSVEPVRGALKLSGYSACGQDGGVQLPRQYVDDGVNDADLVLLVTTRPTMGNTLAWAVACERDQWGRAIAGHVNVAPRHLTEEQQTLLSATLIHEVMHVLGFDPHAFAHFRDDRKRRRTRVVVHKTDPQLGREVTRVVLPRVVMHAREHFGAYSPEFEGLELEDGGGRGTAGSHWEKRLLMNEIMTGSVDTRSTVSSMTLALLEDSGWYKANFSMAEPLGWGHNQGTSFPIQRCDKWSGAYRCNDTHLSGCTYNREAEGYCPIVRYERNLPEWARYFEDPDRGGQSSLADYCAYYVAYSDGSCVDAATAHAPDHVLGEMRGPDSRCMSSSLVRAGYVRGTMGQGHGCYRQRCRNNTLQVAVDESWKDCPYEGGPVAFEGFNGELICPAYYELCEDESRRLIGQCPGGCNHNGECMDGECHCFLGFTGADCSKRVCPEDCSGHGTCTANGVCRCHWGYTGADCSTATCDEQCSQHGGVCDNGVCEFRCSDYAGYTCQNSSSLIPSLQLCGEVLLGDNMAGQHCAPSDRSILQQLEPAVVLPNYYRLIPTGRSFLSMLDNGHCDAAARRLACWISIQRCDKDGDNRLRVCHSACASYNAACGARLDCSDRTLFSGGLIEEKGACTGDLATRAWWQMYSRTLVMLALIVVMSSLVLGGIRQACGTCRCNRRVGGGGSSSSGSGGGGGGGGGGVSVRWQPPNVEGGSWRVGFHGLIPLTLASHGGRWQPGQVTSGGGAVTNVTLSVGEPLLTPYTRGSSPRCQSSSRGHFSPRTGGGSGFVCHSNSEGCVL